METLTRAKKGCTDALRLWNPNAVWLNSLLIVAGGILLIAAAVDLAYFAGAQDVVYTHDRSNADLLDLGIGATVMNVLAIVFALGFFIIGSMGLYNTLCKDVP
jgi:hypothetical protein